MAVLRPLDERGDAVRVPSSSDDVAVALPRDDDDGGDASPASPASPASSAGQVDDDDAASSPASSTAAYASAARWGADTFCATARRQLRTRELRPECKQRHVNFLLLGPAGVGKSSLIHTCWRALRPSEAGGEDRDALMAALQLGWSRDDAARRAAERGKGGGLRAKHGTTRFNAYALQRRQPPGDGPIFGAGAVGLYAQDTKGHQFFDAKEQAFAARLVDGAVREGSTQERASLRYWALLSKVGLGGLLRSAEAADCPSVVVLVFDLTLRSFLKMLRASDDDPQLGCYRKIAAHAKAQGLGCLAVRRAPRATRDAPPRRS